MRKNSQENIADKICKEIAKISCVTELQAAKKNYSEFMVCLPMHLSNKIYEAMKAKEKQLS